MALSIRKLQNSRAEHLQKAMEGGSEEEIQQAWIEFYNSIVQDVKNDIEYTNNLIENELNQKENSHFMKVNNFKNINSFKKAFVGDIYSKDGIDVKQFAKGVLFNDWGEAQQEYIGKNVDGSVIMPTEIVAEVVYKAAQKSVLLGNCPIHPMKEGTTLIGRIKDDVELDFKEKYKEGKETGLSLEGIKLEAKTLYAYVEIAEEDLQDLENIEEILNNAFAGAVARTLDNNFLYTNTNSSSKKGVYPNGILDNPNIKIVEVSEMDYDAIAKAKLEISKGNGTANTLGYNPELSFILETKKDTTGQYINPPEFFNNLTKIESNGLKNKDAVLFDNTQILIGIRKTMDIKLMPKLENGTVLLRCMLRADVATLRDDHICKITVQE